MGDLCLSLREIYSNVINQKSVIWSLFNRMATYSVGLIVSIARQIMFWNGLVKGVGKLYSSFFLSKAVFSVFGQSF